MSIDTIYEGSCIREKDTVINKDDTGCSNSSICMICMIDRVDEIEHISKCRCTIKHLYCRSCIYSWYRTTRRLSCPVCRFGDIVVDQFTQTSEHSQHNQIIEEGTVIVYDDDVLNNQYDYRHDNRYDDQIDLHDTILFDDITLNEVVGFISSLVTSTLTSLFNTVENSLIYSLLKLWNALYRQTFQERTHGSRQRLEFFKVFKTTVHLLSMLLIRFVLSVMQYYIDAF
ncbi:hypothetical protein YASMINEVIRUS_1226 [Yasminevirus sp. GU-2018]|uniref:RING-type domain-containing protein n=1 Tax=Yasminevirus sp. GU-2018 TaxID=2420051 RepID=A0A5K0UAE5_9VIRU|nr:hypothetical protein YASMINEVIRUS_1226 [Yasminevirus sp. GU-2018]